MPDTENVDPERSLGERGLATRGIHIDKRPQWFIWCEECDWSTEHWDKPASLEAARNHAECHPKPEVNLVPDLMAALEESLKRSRANG